MSADINQTDLLTTRACHDQLRYLAVHGTSPSTRCGARAALAEIAAMLLGLGDDVDLFTMDWLSEAARDPGTHLAPTPHSPRQNPRDRTHDPVLIDTRKLAG
jgi:hypothetical protein